MNGSEIAAVIGALGTLMTVLGGAVGWFVKRVDERVNRLERRIGRLERHKITAIRHISRLEIELTRMGGTIPQTDGWPPDDDNDEELS